jgi:hypothetical protein
MTHVNRQSYVGPGIDGSAMMAQAERRRDKFNETTIVHAHKYDKSRNLCSLKCKILAPGFRTRSIGEEPVPIEEEKY